jgi:siroheme synthase
VIENGTRSNEIRAYGRLEGLSELIQERGIQGPALLIIGEVAAYGRDADFECDGTRADVPDERVSLSDLWGLLS